jgi:hypothetical protein
LPRRDEAQVVQDGPPRLVGYARISMDDQTTALQSDALARAAVDVVFEEEASGANTARPVLAKTLAALRSGDTLVVWRLDCWGSSTRSATRRSANRKSEPSLSGIPRGSSRSPTRRRRCTSAVVGSIESDIRRRTAMIAQRFG